MSSCPKSLSGFRHQKEVGEGSLKIIGQSLHCWYCIFVGMLWMPKSPEEAFDIWVNVTAELFPKVSGMTYFVGKEAVRSVEPIITALGKIAQWVEKTAIESLAQFAK